MGAPNLLNPERRMLRAMQLSDADRSWDLASLLAACDWTDQAVAVGAGHGLENHGYVSVSETRMREVRLDVEGERAVEDGLLEQRLWSWISEQSTATMTDLQQAFERHEAGPGVGLLQQLGGELEAGARAAGRAASAAPWPASGHRCAAGRAAASPRGRREHPGPACLGGG